MAMVNEYFDVTIKVPNDNDKSTYKYDDSITIKRMPMQHVGELMSLLTQYTDEIGFELRFHREKVSQEEIAQTQAQMDCASVQVEEADAEPIEGEEVW